MKKLSQIIAFLFLLGGMAMQAQAQTSPASADKTESPYFLVKGAKGIGQMPLKSTRAEVNIAGVIADVTITQVYQNNGKNTLEAIYVFPASSQAAVYGMQMHIGNRTITAEIREKKKAREEYEAAKKEGKTASLLEQQRPNVFQMNVANIQPGDLIEVELKYTELLAPTDGKYQFVYPTVVGPRYSEGKASESDAFPHTPYTPKGVASTYDFDLKVNLEAGMAIQSLSSSSHNVAVKYAGTKSATVTLAEAQEKSGNRDFIMEYALAGGKIESGLLLYEHGDENFFVAMVQPPKRVVPATIPPREYIFIVDVSGSMNGWPLDVSKKLLRNLITGLRPTDKFNVMLFAGATAVMEEQSIFATSENIERALNVLQNQRGGGGTRLYPALEQALAMDAPAGMARSFVVVTDGYISVEKECFDLIRENLDKANLFPFGIGSGVNRFLMDGLAHVGMSESFVATSHASADLEAERFRKYIQSPVLTHVKATFEGFDAYDVEPVSIPDVFAARPILIYGKYKGAPKGEIVVKGHSGENPYTTRLKVNEYAPDAKNEAVRYLWARKKIQMLGDYKQLTYGDSYANEITQLGLQYNLMTDYTSFIAVDQVVRKNANGKLETINQVLPLPENVENDAVGFELSVNEVRMAKPSKTGIHTADAKKNVVVREQKQHVKIGHIASQLSQSMEQLLADWVEQEQVKLEGCQKLISGNIQTIQIEISLDRNGKVSQVNFIGEGIKESLKRTLKAIISKWNYTGGLTQPVKFQIPVTFQK